MDSIAVFYSDEAVADADSFSPSAAKPRAVVNAWRAARLPIDVRPILPVTLEELSAAHDAAFVQGVLKGRIDNGFQNRQPDVARSLSFTSGAMLCAARHALVQGIACAPVSGFHHASYASAGGYCTFNGLMVAAIRLLAEGAVRRVMVLDCDMHYGNGTDDIIERLAMAAQVDNVTFGRWFTTPAQATAYLERLEREVARIREFDLVLCQAGADVHVDDPLGGVLTTEQMRIRDEIVFRAARTAGVPLAWNLAGGYQQPLSIVVDLHTQTMRACVKAFVSEVTPGTG
jgi:acetoin utilization deacetylase AcuC-like enzyme